MNGEKNFFHFILELDKKEKELKSFSAGKKMGKMCVLFYCIFAFDSFSLLYVCIGKLGFGICRLENKLEKWGFKY